MMLFYLAYAIRALRRDPGFTVPAAILILAVGIGANTAMFSVFHAVILRPLGVDDSGRIVMIWPAQPNRVTAKHASAQLTIWWPQLTSAVDPDASRGLPNQGEVRLTAASTQLSQLLLQLNKALRLTHRQCLEKHSHQPA